MYLANSVKGVERKRRGYGEKLIIESEKKKPRDWKEFFTSYKLWEQERVGRHPTLLPKRKPINGLSYTACMQKEQATSLCGLQALTAMLFSFLCTMQVGWKTLRSCLKQVKATKGVAWILVNLQIHSHPHYAVTSQSMPSVDVIATLPLTETGRLHR